MKKALFVTLKKIPAIAKDVAKMLKGGEILALSGPLGAGKTTFVKALGKQLKIRRPITSPTFNLLHRFPARLKNTGKPVWFYHLDLYRTKNFREVRALGVNEFWGRKDSITAIEWADKIKKYLPKKAMRLIFKNL